MIFEEGIDTGYIKHMASGPRPYAFIGSDRGGPDTYVPADMARGLQVGQQVRFAAKLGARGPVATKVEVTERRPVTILNGRREAGVVDHYDRGWGKGSVIADWGQLRVTVLEADIRAAGLPGLRKGTRVEFTLESDGRGGYVARQLKIERPVEAE